MNWITHRLPDTAIVDFEERESDAVLVQTVDGRLFTARWVEEFENKKIERARWVLEGRDRYILRQEVVAWAEINPYKPETT